MHRCDIHSEAWVHLQVCLIDTDGDRRGLTLALHLGLLIDEERKQFIRDRFIYVLDDYCTAEFDAHFELL